MAGSIDRVRAAAAAAGLEIEVRRMGASTRTAEEAAAQCGCGRGQGRGLLMATIHATQIRQPVEQLGQAGFVPEFVAQRERVLIQGGGATVFALPGRDARQVLVRRRRAARITDGP